MCARLVCAGEKERKRDLEWKQNAFQEFPKPKRAGLSFIVLLLGEGLGVTGTRGREVKAVVIETRPNQTHFHFYQFAPPKMLIR